MPTNTVPASNDSVDHFDKDNDEEVDILCFLLVGEIY